MSSERKLVAVQLANQQLTESMEKIAAEIAELREQNEHLTEENTSYRPQPDVENKNNRRPKRVAGMGKGQTGQSPRHTYYCGYPIPGQPPHFKGVKR